MNKLTLGCDPELICRCEGKPVPARNYFRENSSFGLDGHNYTAELRPGVSESPIDMTSKIQQILQYGHDKHTELEFYAGHYVDTKCIGGHIHFGIPVSASLLENVDFILYSFSDCVDDLNQRNERQSKSNYGQRKAYRTKNYGWEYRTPGSWLLSPAITNTTFTLAKLVSINHIESKVNFIKELEGLNSNDLLNKINEYFPIIPDDCKLGLEHLKILLNKKIDWNQNILKNWGIE